MVLSTGGDSLSIIPSRTNGYNRICLSNNTAATYTFATYAFDGKQHKLEKTETKPIQQLDEAQQPHTLTREQTHFDLEGSVNVPINAVSGARNSEPGPHCAGESLRARQRVA